MDIWIPCICGASHPNGACFKVIRVYEGLSLDDYNDSNDVNMIEWIEDNDVEGNMFDCDKVRIHNLEIGETIKIGDQSVVDILVERLR